jgi:hypothetical protein
MAQDTTTIQAWGVRRVALETSRRGGWSSPPGTLSRGRRSRGYAEKAATLVARLRAVADVETGTVSVQP